MRIENPKVNLNYFATQNGRSRDPNLGHDPLFADPALTFGFRLEFSSAFHWKNINARLI